MDAAIFDCDGTLVDSEPLARRAWERTLAGHGYEVTDDDFAEVTGLPFETVHGYFAERASLPPSGPVWREYSGGLFELIDAAARPFPDALETLDELTRARVPVAIASSSSRERLDRTLSAAGLDGRVGVTVAGDEIARGKPAPDLFLSAVERLGARPERCVIVEDAAPGVEAGLAAGATVVAVAREPRERSRLERAHRVVERLSVAALSL
ncbi:MAG TPA: HAD family phosphatase [Thermoleophilaceae bacterium]|nr:HAD family phosphatase [Thermoleophilaceae bacterium]